MNTYEIPSNIGEQIIGLKEKIGLFRQGEINPVQFKGIRVGQGVYEQRKNDTYMFRVRVAGGVITPAQLKSVALISDEFATDHFHVTTRQDVQLHYVNLENTPAVYEKLIAAGLSPRGGGGNTIRNIMSSIDSGISKDEAFDVTPYAVALTTRMINEEDSWNLPRKFKTAFSNSASDNCEATITCLGFIAKIIDGQKGFSVYVGGGMGAKPMPGKLIWDFIPEDQVYSLTKAIKLMFDKNGNRRKRFLAKIKFLVEKLGVEEFRNRVEAEWVIVKASNPAPLDIAHFTYEHKAHDNITVAPQLVQSAEYDLWKTRYVTEQKQAGLYSIKVPLELGDITNKDGVKLGELLEPFGENTIRLAFNQNLHIINIPEAYLGNIFNGLNTLHTQSTQPVMVSNMIACTGASTCRLGLCLPRGVLPETAERLVKTDLNLDSIPEFKIHVSGCPNTCGRHFSADLGFFGRVGRKEKTNYPAYNVLAGAIIRDGQSEFAKKICEIAAKDAPALVEDILRIWIDKKSEFSDFRAWILNGGSEIVAEIAAKYNAAIQTIEENKDYFYDWGATEQFSILHGQQAECAAGVFDMIEVDIADLKKMSEELANIADDSEKKEVLYHIVATAARMLLVTRNIEVKSDEQAFSAFGVHFISSHLVDEKYRILIDAADSGKKDVLLAQAELCVELGQKMAELYKSMDDSLRFPTLTEQASCEA